MQLSFDTAINLTEYANNPAPKNTDQLAIVHEAFDGEIVQYYIAKDSKQAGDKSSTALSVYHEKTNTLPAYYTYVSYPSLIWSTRKGSRITRQRITRLGIKAFPNIGSIAHYKLAYRNISKVMAPVNYSKAKYKAPVLEVEVLANTIQFTITPPNEDNTAPEDLITYQCYRVNMQWGPFTLEYVSYEEVFKVPKPETTGTYSCWCVGYVNEGEATSHESNVVDIFIQGTRPDWPDVTPGSEDIYIKQMYFDQEGYIVGKLTNGGTVKSDNPFDKVSVRQIQQSGKPLADILIAGQSTRIFAPDTGGTAAQTSYDNSESGLAAENVQTAIDEIARDFQDGCDVIVAAVTAKGQVPASNSPEDIAEAISRISSGGDARLGEKVIAANGIYNAYMDGLDGYSKVTVNVPSGGGGQQKPSLVIYGKDGAVHIGVKATKSRKTLVIYKANDELHIGGSV